MLRGKYSLLIAGFIILLPIISFSTTIHVPGNYSNIQSALNAASQDDTILVAGGAYYEDLLFDGTSIVLLASGGPVATIIKGQLTFANGSGNTSTVSGFSIMEAGPAVMIDPGNFPTIENCIIQENSAQSGAGVYTRSGVTIRRCEFINNQSSFVGGAIYAVGASDVIIDSSIFHGNTANNTGPIRIQGCTNVTFSHNIAYGNTAGAGGGFFYVEGSSSVSIINNTIVNNSSSGRGSGITIYSGSSIDIRNNIVAFNQNRPGIYGSSSAVTIGYNDVFGNTSGDYYGISAGPGSISLDPLFIDELSNDYGLQLTSPCINTGDPSTLYYDIDGSRSDMGALAAVKDFPIAKDLQVGNGSRVRVIEDTPLISWTYLDTIGSQLGYEIEVGTNGDWTQAEMWSTGMVTSSAESAVYAGTALEDGATYYLRIRLQGTAGVGGWRELIFKMNSLPTTPVLYSPLALAEVSASGFVLKTENATDSDDDLLSYEFEVYAEPALTIREYHEPNVPMHSPLTESAVISGWAVGSEHYWRVRAFDGYEYSDWSTTESFIIRLPASVSVPADYPTIQSAIEAVSFGDTVIVSAGLYSENIIFDNSNVIVISALGPDSTVIKATYQSLPTVSFINDNTRLAEINGFTITGSNTSGIDCYGSSATIRNNIITENQSNTNSSSGINLHSTKSCLVEGNRIFGNTSTYGPAVHISEGSLNDTIRYNLIYDNNGYGEIMIRDEISGLQISNNTIWPKIYTAITHQGNGLLELRNNIFINSTYYAVLGGGQTEASYNCAFGNADDYSFTPGPGNIYDDPKLSDTVARDFSLLPLSPCINTGDPDPAYTNLDGTRNDIGGLPFSLDLPVVGGVDLASEDLLHLTDHLPNISWQFVDTIGSQTAYELEVGTDTEWTLAEMWATGEVISTTTSVTYSGATLIDGETYYLRARVKGSGDWGSWLEKTFRMNGLPEIPVPVSPLIDIPGSIFGFVLKNENASDAELDIVTYDYEIYGDQSLIELVYAEYDVPQYWAGTSSSLITTLEASKTYYWQVRASDSFEYSEWSTPQAFTLRGPGRVYVPNDFATISEGMQGAYEQDTVIIAPGAYQESLTFGSKNIALISSHGAAVTSIEGGINFFSSYGNTSTIAGLTFHDSYNAINIQRGNDPLIRDCIFRDNTGYRGAAVFTNSVVTIKRCEFYNNVASDAGAAIYAYSTDNLVIDSCVFHDNSSSIGSIFIDDCNVVDITHNLGYHNTATAEGGFLSMKSTSYVNIHNNTIVANYAYYYGSAMRLRSGVMIDIRNNIIAYNQFAAAVSVYSSDIKLGFNDLYSNLSGDYSGISPDAGSISENPMFVDTVSANYQLLVGSPCFNAGDPELIYNDPDGTRNDMGAFPLIMIYPYADELSVGDGDRNLVIDHSPEISWLYTDSLGSQTAYEIQVGSDQNWNIAEMWQTGVITTADQSVTYAGTELLDGAIYYIRIRVLGNSDWGSWLYSSFRMNQLPTIPVLAAPLQNIEVSPLGFTLDVTNATDPELSPLTYDFEVYSDIGLITLVYSESDVVEEASETSSSSITGLEPTITHYWRARCYDQLEYSAWSEAATFTVRTTRTLDVPEQYITIQAAINDANEGDTVLVAPGTYTEHLYVGATSILLMSKQGAAETIVSGDGSAGPMIYIASGPQPPVTIIGFTIRGAVSGDGVRIGSGSEVTIKKCTIANNSTTEDGGGVYFEGASLLIDSCTFVDNYSSEKGGGVYCSGSSIQISNTVFHDNSSVDGGGAIALETVNDAYIFRNQIYKNRTYDDHGGVVYSDNSQNVRIINNTIVNNIATSSGAGITLAGINTVDIRNNIVAFNSGGAGIRAEDETDVVNGYNDVYGNSSAYSGLTPSTTSFSLSPAFVDIDDNKLALIGISPCINAGDPNSDFNDPDGSRNDMGAIAYEASADSDADGIIDNNDNCPTIANTDQLDSDSDGTGDVCDNCLLLANEDQNDADQDGVGDECDICLGGDDSIDTDLDGVPDRCDRCPDFNDMIDTDDDSIPDACDDCPHDPDNDIDGDGFCANLDNCPNKTNADQLDSDGNGSGDVCCCGEAASGSSGNINCDTFGKRNLADITLLIDHVYLNKTQLCCSANGNVDGDANSKINLADITALINHVYLDKNETAPCGSILTSDKLEESNERDDKLSEPEPEGSSSSTADARQ